MSRENVEIKVGVNSSAVKTGLNAAKGQLAEFRNELRGLAVGALGAGFFGSVVAGVKSLVEEGDQIGDLAARFGIAADGLQRIGNAAKLQEGDLDSVAKAMNKLLIAQDKLQKGDEKTTAALAALNINAEDFINLNAEEAFYALADGVKNSEDRTQAYAAVIDLLGKSAGNLFTTLEQGGDKIRSTGEAMGAFSSAALQAFDRIDKASKTLWNGIKVTAAEVIVNMLDGFNGIVSKISEIAARTKYFFGLSSKDELDAALQATVPDRSSEMGEAARERERQRIDEDAEGREKATREREAGEKRIASLRERLADVLAKNDMDRLSSEAKLNSLILQRQEAERAVAALSDPEKKLEAQIKAAQLTADEAAARKKLADEEDRKFEQREQKLAALNEKQFRAAIESLPPEQQKAALTERRAQLGQAIAFLGDGDEEKKLALQEKAADLDRELARLGKEKEKAPEKREGVVSELARKGLGGVAYFAPEVDPQKRAAKAAEDTAKSGKETVRRLERIEETLKEGRWGR